MAALQNLCVKSTTAAPTSSQSRSCSPIRITADCTITHSCRTQTRPNHRLEKNLRTGSHSSVEPKEGNPRVLFNLASGRSVGMLSYLPMRLPPTSARANSATRSIHFNSGRLYLPCRPKPDRHTNGAAVDISH